MWGTKAKGMSSEPFAGSSSPAQQLKESSSGDKVLPHGVKATFIPVQQVQPGLLLDAEPQDPEGPEGIGALPPGAIISPNLNQPQQQPAFKQQSMDRKPSAPSSRAGTSATEARPEDEAASTAKIRICTWNVAEFSGQLMDTDELKMWLGLDSPDHLPDILAVGLQEVDMSVKAMVMDTSKAGKWHTTISQLATAHGMWEVCSQQMMGVWLYLCVRRHLEHAVHTVQVLSNPTGWFGIFGNKGGVLCRFRLGTKWYCFINAHLAAHHNKEMLSSMDCEGMLVGDQLKQQIANGKAFGMFKEADIQWTPTYKFKGDSYSAKRRPAYTDRILWYEAAAARQMAAKVACRGYQSMREIDDSDHKPVFARFFVADALDG